VPLAIAMGMRQTILWAFVMERGNRVEAASGGGDRWNSGMWSVC
jgi:hypothetical protein